MHDVLAEIMHRLLNYTGVTDVTMTAMPTVVAGPMAEGSAPTLSSGYPGITVERTLAIIKPDAIDKADEIIEVIKEKGFTILQVSGFP